MFVRCDAYCCSIMYCQTAINKRKTIYTEGKNANKFHPSGHMVLRQSACQRTSEDFLTWHIFNDLHLFQLRHASFANALLVLARSVAAGATLFDR